MLMKSAKSSDNELKVIKKRFDHISHESWSFRVKIWIIKAKRKKDLTLFGIL